MKSVLITFGQRMTKDEHVDVLGQAASAKVFMKIARNLLEYPGLLVVKLIQKRNITNRLYCHVAGRVSHGVCSGCAS